jgi:phage-related tail protein
MPPEFQPDSPSPKVIAGESGSLASASPTLGADTRNSQDPILQRINSAHREIGQALEQSTVGVERMLLQHHRMMQIQDMLTESQDELSQNQRTMASTLERVMQSMEKMMGAQEHLVKSMTDVYRSMSSTNAALERMDRVLDYLMRRDGERDRFLEELEALGEDLDYDSDFDD